VVNRNRNDRALAQQHEIIATGGNAYFLQLLNMILKKLVKQLRQFRSLHKWIGISLAFFILISSITGVLLGWKKNVELLQPATHEGASTSLNEWISFDRVAKVAQQALDSVTKETIEIDRMDVRPDKGIIKVTFKKGYWEIQVDGATGKVLSVAKRHADWIEHIHDGSIISEFVKVVYTNIIGLGLSILALSGVFLWYGPKAVRKMK
jgi:uncharacterized iron-regulated membrane protein